MPLNERTASVEIDVPEPLRLIKVRPLFSMQLQVPAIQKAGMPGRGLVVGVVSGGRFVGERLAGKVLEGGSDWQRVLSESALRLDCRIVLETNDGAQIAMTYHGIRAGSPEVMARLAAGSPVRADEYYQRIHPSFETGAAQYAWLNTVVAVGGGHRLPGGPIYNIFEVL
jgi:hypothetical protein